MEYQFTPIEDLEDLSNAYLEDDVLHKENIKNGMPKEMHVNYCVMQQFFIRNQEELGVEGFMLKGRALDLVASLCAKHYGKKADELKEAYRSMIEFKFASDETIKKLVRK